MEHTVYVTPLWISAIAFLFLALYGVGHAGQNRAAAPFSVFMFTAALWTALYAVGIVSVGLGEKLFWMRLRLPLLTFLPLPWFLMTVRFLNRPELLSRRRIWWFLLVPALDILFCADPRLFALLVRNNFHLVTDGSGGALLYHSGPWFWFRITYFYGILLWSLSLLLRNLRDVPSRFRGNAVLVLAGAFLAIVTDALFNLGIRLVPGINLTPPLLALTGILVAFSLHRYRPFELAPVAREAVMEIMNDPVFVLDEAHCLAFVNRAAENRVGLPRSTLLGAVARDLPPPWNAILGSGNGKPLRSEFPLGELKDRQWFHLVSSPLADEQGQEMGTLVVLHDITELHRARDTAEALTSAAMALASPKTDLTTLLDTIREQVSRLLDARSLVLSIYNDVTKTWEPQYVSAPGTPELSVSHPLEDGITGHVIATKEALLFRNRGEIDAFLERTGRHTSVSDRPESHMHVPLLFGDRVLGTMRVRSAEPGAYDEHDLHIFRTLASQVAMALENVRLFGEMEQLAVTDPLTGIDNRRHFFTQGEREFTRTLRYGRTLSALMFDLDHFKRVNDRFGHRAGDEVLRAVAGIFRRELRTIDLLGRYGGEEFAALLPETPLDAALIAAERLRTAVEHSEIILSGEELLAVTVSVGVAERQEKDTLDTLLDRADQAMYKAKRLGRNRVEAER